MSTEAPAGHDTAALVPVASYVRMSTLQQDQSLLQQLDHIGRYAAATGCVVVKIYRDEGKSGLNARRRVGLLQMLADIGAGDAGYDRVLVYDVSRWGRFQDIDESAYYEYWCRQHGIAVVYCSEHFANDGSPLSHIIKSVKRTMAAEYSRALSQRTFEAHAFLLARGYKPGGAAGYGLRRVCLRTDGTVRRELLHGERKGHPTDRVVLAPGPQHEVDTVRRIFRLYIEDKLGYRALARQLNQKAACRSGIGVGDDDIAGGGRQWTEARVKAVLTNEKYCGVLLYNRTTGRLGKARRATDRDLWLRQDGAHAPLVPPAVFAAARRQARLHNGEDKEAVLEALRGLHARDGRLTSRLIDAEPGLPHTAMIKRRFGSLHAAYVLAVGDRTPSAQAVAGWAILLAMRVSVERMALAAGAMVEKSPVSGCMRLAGLDVRLAAVRCRCRGGSWGWVVPARCAGAAFVLAALIDREGLVVRHYALLDHDSITAGSRWLSAAASSWRGILTSPQLEDFFGDCSPI